MQKLFRGDLRSLSGHGPWIDFKLPVKCETEYKMLDLFAYVHTSREIVPSLHHTIQRTPQSKTMW